MPISTVAAMNACCLCDGVTVFRLCVICCYLSKLITTTHLSTLLYAVFFRCENQVDFQGFCVLLPACHVFVWVYSHSHSLAVSNRRETVFVLKENYVLF